MNESHAVFVTGEFLDESERYSLSELMDICGIDDARLIEFIQYGVVEPAGEARENWRFFSVHAWRLHRAIRLQSELGLNVAGAALCLDLLDEIASLRVQLRSRRRA